MQRWQRSIMALVIGLMMLTLGGPVAGEDGLVRVVQPADMVLQPDAGPGRARVVYQLDPEVDFALIYLGENDRGQTVVRDRLLPGGVGVGVIEPCAGGGSDLPGAEITMRYDAFKTVQERIGFGVQVFTLGTDAAQPAMRFVAPTPGTAVRPGQRIEFHIEAEEPRNAATWQTGVREISFIAPDRAVENVTFGDTGPLPCEEKAWRRSASFAYTVPENAQPGQEFFFGALSLDWQGNIGLTDLTLMVEGDEWEGTVSWRWDVLDGDTGGVSWGEVVEAQFAFVVDLYPGVTQPAGVIRGRGRATRTTHGGRSNDCTITSYTHPLTSPTIEIGGALYDGKFVIILMEPPGATLTLTQVCDGRTLPPATVPSSGGEAMHAFVIQVPARDGARTSLDETVGNHRVTGSVSVRQRRPIAGAALGGPESELAR